MIRLVWGYVLDERGQPLKGDGWSWLRFVDSMGAAETTGLAADGSYTMPGLASGRWYVTAGAMRRRMQDAVIDLSEDTSSVRQDFHLEPQPSVLVKLLAPNGQPFWDVARDLPSGLAVGTQMVAVATREPPGERFGGVVGSLNNRFGVGSMWFNGQGDVKLPAEYWGRIDLYVDPPVYVSLVLYHDVIDTQFVDGGQSEVTLTLDPAAILARLGGVELEVVDGTTGAPIASASADLFGKGMGPTQKAADERGHVAFEGQAPGTYNLKITAKGKAALRREVEVPRGRSVDLGTLTLAEAVLIRGRTVDEDERGMIAELRVEAVQAAGRPLDPSLSGVSSGPDGSFELTSLPAGLWSIQAKDRKDGRLSSNAAERMSPNVVVDTRAGPVENVCLRLEPVSAAVVRWTGPDPDGQRLRFYDEQGLWRQSGGFLSSAPSRIDLPPGTWRLVVVDSGGATRAERSFTLGAEPVVLELGPDR